MLAIRESPIMMAQNSPKVEKKPILDWLITRNPAMSDTAEPKSDAPPSPGFKNRKCPSTYDCHRNYPKDSLELDSC